MIFISNLESYILREIGALSRCIQIINDNKFKQFDLKKGQFIFLTRICENKGINQIDLSNILKVDKTTTTKAIQKLIEAGFVVKRRDITDKRMWRLYPEQKALDLYPLIISEENKTISICYNDFKDEDKELVYKMIRKMRENIEVEWSVIKTSGGSIPLE